MVKKQVVLETVKKMVDSGLDDETIASTLKEIGLSDKETDEYISAAKGGIPENGSELDGEEEPESEEHEIIAEKTAKKVKEQLNENHELIEAQHSITQAALQEHAEAISEVHEKVSGLHEKMDKYSSGISSQEILNKMIELNSRLSTMEKQLSELKAVDLATKSLLEKIFDANRSILSELERK